MRDSQTPCYLFHYIRETKGRAEPAIGHDAPGALTPYILMVWEKRRGKPTEYYEGDGGICFGA